MNRIVRRLARLRPSQEVIPTGAILALVLIGGLLVARGAVAQSDGGHSLSWWTADGGGGSSEAGDHMLLGTAGQPDAGVMAGGDYLLASGFLPGGELPDWFRVYLPVVVRNH